jgi:hypothetical protein
MPQPLSITQKLVIFKVALIDIADILNNSKLSERQKKEKILSLIDEELNYPDEQDKEYLVRMRDRIMKHGR